jgi:putative ABC transport system permease protein
MQRFIESASIAVQAIWANKLRSLLTVAGNIVAVTSIIAVVSLVQGLNASVSGAITSQVGVDQFSIVRFPPTFSDEEQQRVQSNPRVTLDDAEAVRKIGRNIGLVMARAQGGAEAKTHNEKLDSLNIRGVSKEWNQLPDTNIAIGRSILPSEFDAKRAVTVLGADAADKLFGALDPIDKFVQFNGVPFRVVGVAAKQGAFFGQSQDEFAVIPLGVYQRMFNWRQSLTLVVRPVDPSLVAEAKDDATMALRIQRRLRPSARDNFGVISSDTFLALYNQATSGIFAILIGVVALSLVVGGIVIMNIMLMVVSERTREIGLRKALGARRRDILWQILTESITLSTLGGVIGTVAGFFVAWVISKLSPLPANVEPWAVLMGITMTAIVGLFFGMYPAMQASKLDPIEALRRE